MPVHAASRTYDLTGLAADRARLSPVVAYDRAWLGDLTGLDVVHLQCHIGSDTISLARVWGGGDDEALRVLLPYFTGYLLRWESDETYTDGAKISSPEMFEWNHGLGDIVQAVLDAGLEITALREHRECEWQAFEQLVEGDDGKYRLPEMPERLPLMFTLEARAPRGG